MIGLSATEPATSDTTTGLVKSAQGLPPKAATTTNHTKSPRNGAVTMLKQMQPSEEVNSAQDVAQPNDGTEMAAVDTAPVHKRSCNEMRNIKNIANKINLKTFCWQN